MMAIMGCFAIFRLDDHRFVLAPGNLAVTIALLAGAAVVHLNRPYSLAIGLLAAGFTAVMGVVAWANFSHPSPYVQLPGYPLIWVVIGLYIAFRLVINHQHQQRLHRRAEPESAPAAEEDPTDGEG